MLRKVSTLSIAGALIAGVLVSTPAYAAVSNGSTCTVINKTTKVGGYTYKCVTAVKTSVVIDQTAPTKKSISYIPASAKTKNAKKYYLAADCISEAASYLKSVKELASIDVATKKALADIDVQIASQVKASSTVQAQIDSLTQQNVNLELKIVEQTALIVVAESKATDLVAKVAKVTKDIDDFTVILEKSKADVKVLEADTANKVRNAATISTFKTAISKLSTAITSIKTARASSNMQIQAINSSINKYNSTILQLKGTIAKNSSTIDTAKNISATVDSLNKTRVKTVKELQDAKDEIGRQKTNRDLLCVSGA
jgi:chromosome segregation ATPase